MDLLSFADFAFFGGLWDGTGGASVRGGLAFADAAPRGDAPFPVDAAVHVLDGKRAFIAEHRDVFVRHGALEQEPALLAVLARMVGRDAGGAGKRGHGLDLLA